MPLIAQTPAKPAEAPAFDQELTDLKAAYDQGAITSVEWSNAKTELTKKFK